MAQPFKELAVGQSFKFASGLWNHIATKSGKRAYTWYDEDGRKLTSHVGTVNVQVLPLVVDLQAVT